jgi:hypothetical protein
VWSHLKWSLANLTKHTIAGFTALIKTGRDRCSSAPRSWLGCFASTDLEFGPFL